MSYLELFCGVARQTVHCLKDCTWPIFFPFLLLVQLCWYWVRPAQSCIHNFLTTCSPCSHIFFFSASQWLWVRLSGSSAAAELHSPGCFAVAWLQASVLRHWLEVRRARHPLAKRAGKNRAFIGCRDTAGLLGLARFGGSSHPWRLSLCKHPGCFLQWECVYQQLSFAGVSRLRPSVSEE